MLVFLFCNNRRHKANRRLFPQSLIGNVFWAVSTVFCLASCGTTPVPEAPQATGHTKEIATVEASSNQGQVNTIASAPDSAQETSTPNIAEKTAAKIDSDKLISSSPKSSYSKPSATNSPGAAINKPRMSGKGVSPKHNNLAVYQPAVTTIFPASNTDVPEFPILTADQRVQNAVVFLNHGNEFQARKELADALVIEPSNRSARKLMRLIRESSGNWFQKQRYFNYQMHANESLISVAKKFYNDPLDFYLLAKFNNIKSPEDLAAGVILKIPETHGAVQDNEEDIVTTEPQTEAEAGKPSEDEIKLKRAKVYYSEHRYEEAIALLSQVIRNTNLQDDQAMRTLLAENYRDYSDVLIAKGDLPEAQTVLEESVKLLPDNNDLVSRLLNVKNDREAERLYQLGLDEIKIGKEDLALKTMSRVLQLNPDHFQAKKQITDLKLSVIESYHKEAMVLYRKQELSQAIQIWDKILQLDPNYDLAKQYKAKAMELERKIEQL